MSDASDVGWGYQILRRPAGFRGWSGVERRIHINVKELLVPLLFSVIEPIPALLLRDDNRVAVPVSPAWDIQIRPYCVPFGARSSAWLALFHLHLYAGSCRSGECVAGALSRFRGSSLEWQLCPDAAALCRRWALRRWTSSVPPLCQLQAF
ncbi:hypothetical protein GWK47_031864 [Chionoecetes opilio]|uniref:Uncharacterized protein n=1 Tax=Chionoecetes opilio TaxID=41210 RepID=A0A8J4YQQ8_CHIOP|nr:hypothetical protein GWK47_031864 [Chionoecetes opilio]